MGRMDIKLRPVLVERLLVTSSRNGGWGSTIFLTNFKQITVVNHEI